MRRLVDRLLNTVRERSPYRAETAAVALHQQLRIADLHADSLMWGRNLLRRSSWGHVDLPRLIDGNVSLQVFSVVTAMPLPPKPDNNRDRLDLFRLLTHSKGWPVSTRNSRLQRALYQADKLAGFVEASAGKLAFVRNQQDLKSLLQQRALLKPVVGALLSLEGVHALEGALENIELLYQRGFRLLGLSHFTDNAMAGSTHGFNKHGLTDMGRELVSRAEQLNMIIDVSHSSTQTIDDVMAITGKPVIASHGGVRGTCNRARNLEDRHIRAIANSGGVIGAGLFKYATCGKTVDATVNTIRYIRDLVGVKHVALGSDFDGSVKTLFDTSGWVRLTEALLDSGFSETEVRAIMGENIIHLFSQALPVN